MLRIRKAPPVLTSGKYSATIVEVKSVDSQYGPRMMWTVDATHEEHTYRAAGYTDTTFYEGSMEHRWASAILGMTLMADEELSEEELKGHHVVAEITCKAGRDGSKMFYNIVDLLPLTTPVGPKPDRGQPSPAITAGEEDVPFGTPPAESTSDTVPF
jgi:hypothetical protein